MEMGRIILFYFNFQRKRTRLNKTRRNQIGNNEPLTASKRKRADLQGFCKSGRSAKENYFRFAKVREHSIFISSVSVDNGFKPHYW
jgi:hypothetical protein